MVPSSSGSSSSAVSEVEASLVSEVSAEEASLEALLLSSPPQAANTVTSMTIASRRARIFFVLFISFASFIKILNICFNRGKPWKNHWG